LDCSIASFDGSKHLLGPDARAAAASPDDPPRTYSRGDARHVDPVVEVTIANPLMCESLLRLQLFHRGCMREELADRSRAGA
jgi:hypothetical protein